MTMRSFCWTVFLLFTNVLSTVSLVDGRIRQQERELLQIPGQNKSICEILTNLPDECSCYEPDAYGVIVKCVKVFNSSMFNDTIGIKMNFDPCDPNGSSMSLDVTEENHQIDYPIQRIRAGEEKNFPIPGASVHVPGLANLGLDLAVMILGNLDSLIVKVGLNACAGVRTHQVCAEQIPGLDYILPWWALNGTYSFGDVCGNDLPEILAE